MTFTLDPIHVYLAVNLVLAGLLLYNVNKINKMREDINSLWQNIAMMAIASGGAFDKLEKKIDQKSSTANETEPEKK